MKYRIRLTHDYPYRVEFELHDIERIMDKKWPTFYNYRSGAYDKLVDGHMHELETVLIPWLESVFKSGWQMDMRENRLFLRLRKSEQLTFFKLAWG